MAALRRFVRRMLNVVAPGRAERELTREVASHLAILEDEFKSRGLSDDEARVAARRALGGTEQAKNSQRDARSFVWLDDLRRDTAYAIRTLLRSPGFAFVAILTLALTIGANTAIFTVVDHVLLRSLPLPNADRLVRLYESNPSAGRPRESGSPANVTDWRRAAAAMDPIALVGGTSVTMTGAAEPETMTAMTIGPEFFALTGVRLALGHPFDPPEYQSIANAALGPFALGEKPTTPASVIISHGLWQRQFGGNPNVVGRPIALNGTPAIVAGVMPAGFWFDQFSWGTAECWLPLVESQMQTQRRFRQFTVIGRLKPGVTTTAAQSEMTAIAANLAKAYPKDDGGWTVAVEPLQDSLVSEARPTLLILLGGIGCVLLIACANIANLLLMRSAGRAREVAVRMAIGAGRSRLVRQWLTESALLALVGGLVGFVIAVWSVPALVANAPLKLPHLDAIAVDGRIFAVSMALSLVTGMLCGIAPALGVRDVGLANLRTVAAVSGGARRRWLRPSLVVVQVGLAIVLLVGAGLMGRTLMAVHSLELGFDTSHVLTFGVGLRGDRYEGVGSMLAFDRDLIARLQRAHGVEAAGIGMVPFVGRAAEGFLIEGRDAPLSSHVDVTSPGYLRALRFRLTSGRLLDEADGTAAAPVAMVSTAFARLAWARTDVVGRRLRADTTPVTDWITVVGVVDDVRVTALEADPTPTVFVSYLQPTPVMSGNFVVRTSAEVDALPIVRDTLRAIDPALAVTRVATMDERVARFLAPRQFNVWLIGVFSLLALVLAVVGVYGLVNEAVTNRTAEIGVRIALGATPLQVVRVVTGTTLVVTAIGLVLGLAGAAAATRALGSMIFGVKPLDLLTLAAVPAVFVIAAMLAALVPARRATRVDPVIALRGD